jgi:hypothetical protein
MHRHGGLRRAKPIVRLQRELGADLRQQLLLRLWVKVPVGEASQRWRP